MLPLPTGRQGRVRIQGVCTSRLTPAVRLQLLPVNRPAVRTPDQPIIELFAGLESERVALYVQQRTATATGLLVRSRTAQEAQPVRNGEQALPALFRSLPPTEATPAGIFGPQQAEFATGSNDGIRRGSHSTARGPRAWCLNMTLSSIQPCGPMWGVETVPPLSWLKRHFSPNHATDFFTTAEFCHDRRSP